MSSPSDITPNPEPTTPETGSPTPEPAAQPPIPFNIGEEFSAPSKKLPPARIVLICIGVIAVIVGIYSFINRPQAQAKGSIDTITSVDLPTQNSVVVAMNVSIYNTGEKPFYIRNISAEIQNDAGTFTDKALSPMDFDRYYQAFPDLKKAPLDPLKVETKIEPGSSTRGTMIVIFPVSADAFAHRKTLRVIVQPYDQPVSLVLTK